MREVLLKLMLVDGVDLQINFQAAEDGNLKTLLKNTFESSILCYSSVCTIANLLASAGDFDFHLVYSINIIILILSFFVNVYIQF